MYLTINGRVQVGPAEMYRIDDLDSGKSGLTMMQEPFALVLKKEDAEAIIAAMNVTSGKAAGDTKE